MTTNRLEKYFISPKSEKWLQRYESTRGRLPFECGPRSSDELELIKAILKAGRTPSVGFQASSLLRWLTSLVSPALVSAPSKDLPLEPYKEVRELIEYRMRVGALEVEIADLRRRLEYLEAAKVSSPPSKPPSDGELLRIFQVTRDLFPGNQLPEVAHDPEDSENEFIVITVIGNATTDDLIERRLKWHDLVEQLFPGTFGRYRLSIIPQDGPNQVH